MNKTIHMKSKKKPKIQYPHKRQNTEIKRQKNIIETSKNRDNKQIDHDSYNQWRYECRQLKAYQDETVSAMCIKKIQPSEIAR